MNLICVNYETALYYTVPLMFAILFLAVFVIFYLINYHYKKEIKVLALQEIIEDLDLELGLMRKMESVCAITEKRLE